MGFLSSLPRTSMCCCCIDLRTGSIILAILQLSNSMFNLAFAVTKPTDFNERIFESMEEYESDPEMKDVVQATSYSSHTANLISMIFAIILLFGSIKRNTLFLKIYVLFNLIASGLLGILVIAGLIFIPVLGIILLIILLISLYYLFCINSFLQLILDQKVRTPHVEIDFKPIPAHQQIIITS